MRGRNRLAKAMRYVTGKVASPFEAKTSILIGSPRRVGGLGFAGFKNNLEIKLDDNAQRICGLKNAYGDIAVSYTHLDVYKRQEIHPGTQKLSDQKDFLLLTHLPELLRF